NHHPQPPGYPLFVASARVLNLFVRDAGLTFKAIALLTAILCLPLAAAIGKRLAGNTAGESAVWLLVLNPVFWQASLTGPLRGYLALFSLLSAYCAWRAWSGERQ